MAITLADMSARAELPLKKGVLDVMRAITPFMDMLPIEDSGSMSLKTFRTKTMPGIDWRSISEDHGSGKAEYEPVYEQGFSFGNTIDVDKVYVKDKANLIDPRAYQTEQSVKALSREFVDKIINGSPAVDQKAIVGLWHRLVNGGYAASQNILAASGGLDVSADAGALAANQNTLIDVLDKLKSAVRDMDAFLMNDTMLLRIQSALRQQGLLAITQDSFGRDITTYGVNGPKLVDMGYKPDDDTFIIGNVEAIDGSAITGGTATSIYAVKLGVEHLTGWQMYPLEVEDVGMLENRVTYRTVIDWVVGLSLIHPRCIGRAHGIIAA
ncbi:MAG: hypothetical protein K8R40_02290 [Anaerolineaceae bacterium]|nr:hypothetical protein [Anaerolineaceae bacterium]